MTANEPSSSASLRRGTFSTVARREPAEALLDHGHRVTGREQALDLGLGEVERHRRSLGRGDGIRDMDLQLGARGPPRRRTARERRRLGARRARARPLPPPAAPARRRRLPGRDGRGRGAARVGERATRARHGLRRRHEPRGPRHPGRRRHLARPHAPGPHPRAAPGRLPRGRPARRDALAPERGRRRARPLVPGRPGRGRDARRDGRDERERHDDRPLRRHAGARPRARGRARGRQRDPRPARRPSRRRPATTCARSSSARRGRSA